VGWTPRVRQIRLAHVQLFVRWTPLVRQFDIGTLALSWRRLD